MAGDVNEVLLNEDFVELGAGPAALEPLRRLLESLPGVRQLKMQDEHVQVYFADGVMDPSDLNRYCFEQGIALKHLQLRKRSLESKFMEITK